MNGRVLNWRVFKKINIDSLISTRNFLAKIIQDAKSDIEEEFKESDLPFLVELVNWKSMQPEFRGLIKDSLTLIN